MSATEEISDAIVYKSRGTSDSRGTKRWRCESLPGGCPADSTSYEQTMSDSSVHVVGGRIPTSIPAGLALDHTLVRTEIYIETASSVLLLRKSNEPPWNPSD